MIQVTVFIVDSYSKCLKNACARCLSGVFLWKCFVHTVREIECASKWTLLSSLADDVGDVFAGAIRLSRVFHKNSSERFAVKLVH